MRPLILPVVLLAVFCVSTAGRAADRPPNVVLILVDDLSEQNDLSRKMPDKVDALNKKLDTMLRHTGAKMPRKK